MDSLDQSTDLLIQGWEGTYQATGSPVTVDFRSLITDAVSNRFTHLIHPYPAKLLPHIPILFLRSRKLLPRTGVTTVADPFCGSGTVLLEALLQGHNVLGADSNPLARLITEVKTRPLRTSDLHRALERIEAAVATMARQEAPPVVNLAYWYSRGVAQELAKLRVAINRMSDGPVRSFMRVCLSLCARKMSRADPRLAVPVRINPKRKSAYGGHYRQLRQHLDGLTPASVGHVFHAIATKNARRVSDLQGVIDPGQSVRLLNSVLELGARENAASVDLVITSPPYLGAQKYVRASSLSLGWVDLAYEGDLRTLERQSIGREHFPKHEVKENLNSELAEADTLLGEVRKVNPTRAHIAATYLREMKAALEAIYRSVKRGGHLILIVGPNTIVGHPFDTPRFLQLLAHNAGFNTKFVLIDDIRSRGLMTKRNKTAGVINSEMVICLHKST